MTDLESELRAVWDKYEPQRKADRDAARIRATAANELAELNARRAAAGLDPVGTYQSANLQMQAQHWAGSTRHITWLDEMQSELVSAIRRSFEVSE